MGLNVTLSPKQRAAINSKADFVVFGGGNGPGKTFTLTMVPLLPEYLGAAGCESVIFAEDCQKLEQAGGVVIKCLQYYSQAHPNGEDGYRRSAPRRWIFPVDGGGSSSITLSFIGEPGKWDGMEAAVICIDQIEQVTEKQAFSVFGRNRSTAPGVRCRIFATANPPEDGRNHWLTKMLTAGGWIGEDGFPLQAQAGVIRYYTRHPDTDEFVFGNSPEELRASGLLPMDVDGQPIPPSSMTFFPALIDDHPNAEYRRAYKSKLASLPMFERRRRLEGNWYVSEEAGKYFNAAMFKVVDYLPSRYCRQVRSWDNAWSTSDKADWTPGVLESFESDGGIYICDVLRIRGTFSHVERAVEMVAEVDGKQVVIRLPKDAGAAGGLQSGLAQRLGAKGYTVVQTADKGDKLSRSKPYQACAERGQIRLANMHTTQRVALAMLDPFEESDKHGQIVRVAGLDRSAVSTLSGWHAGFIEEHVRFGRDTVAKRHIKKDTVDAAVGGYEYLTGSDDVFPIDPSALAGSEASMSGIADEMRDLFAPTRRWGY
jgi:phage terminase large subunit-like protein